MQPIEPQAPALEYLKASRLRSESLVSRWPMSWFLITRWYRDMPNNDNADYHIYFGINSRRVIYEL